MICPNCNQDHPKVEETRTTDEVIWRVRRCKACGWRVTTKEMYAEEDEQSIPDHIRKPRKYTKDDGVGHRAESGLQQEAGPVVC